MKLNSEQKHSAGWILVRQYATERLAELRARLEGDLPEKDTVQARASIREMKRLLDLENPEQELDNNG